MLRGEGQGNPQVQKRARAKRGTDNATGKDQEVAAALKQYNTITEETMEGCTEVVAVENPVQAHVDRKVECLSSLGGFQPVLRLAAHGGCRSVPNCAFSRTGQTQEPTKRHPTTGNACVEQRQCSRLVSLRRVASPPLSLDCGQRLH